MQLLGRNADFSAETELKAIGKARRGVDVDRRRVHFLKESLRRIIIAGDDALRVTGVKAVDVINGLIERIDHLAGNLVAEVFSAVIFIGRLFNTGHVDFTRTVAVTGSEVLKPAYCKLQVGALLTNVFAGNVTKDKDLRYISGNVLTGKQVSPNGFLGAFHSQLTVIPEGDDIHEMLGWIMPRFNQFSANHSYFSWLMGKKEYTLDARIKGGERHMIMSGEYDRVFPMDILPEYLIKAIIAGDIDRMEALGIYEVAPEDFALCEFVCSSKMELQRIVRAGLDMLRSEMA